MDSDQRFLGPPHLYVSIDDQLLVARGAARGEKKRRFTDEQIRSLETMFHSHQTKLEPREKAELARELGLQPRQVAIWFQNKRARWRSKQLEKDFAAFRTKHDALRARVQALKDENQALVTQLQKLNDLMNQQQDPSSKDGGSSPSSSCEAEEDGRPVADGSGSGDEKRNPISVWMPESDQIGCIASVDTVQCEYDHLNSCSTPPDQFCATSELWDSWPLVEWNAVA